MHIDGMPIISLLRTPSGSTSLPGIQIGWQQKYSKKGIPAFLDGIDSARAVVWSSQEHFAEVKLEVCHIRVVLMSFKN